MNPLMTSHGVMVWCLVCGQGNALLSLRQDVVLSVGPMNPLMTSHSVMVWCLVCGQGNALFSLRQDVALCVLSVGPMNPFDDVTWCDGVVPSVWSR
jgi:hypothetical protein